MAAPAKKPPRIVDPLAAPTPAPAAAPAQDTSEKDRIKQLEEQLALVMSRLDGVSTSSPKDETVPDNVPNENQILIHFLEDGFTAQGRIWYRGQELVFIKDSPAYNETKGRDGKSWLDWTEEQQESAYGRVIWRHGPWRGKSYVDATFEKMKAYENPDKDVSYNLEELAAAEKKERERRRAAPRLPS